MTFANDIIFTLSRLPLPNDIIRHIFKFVFLTHAKCCKCSRILLRIERHSLVQMNHLDRSRLVVRNNHLIVDDEIALPALHCEDEGNSVWYQDGQPFETSPDIYVMLAPFTRLVCGDAICYMCRIRVLRRIRRVFYRWRLQIV